MVHRAAETVTFGRFKGRHYRDAWNDASYRSWVLAESSETSSRGLRQLKQFFLDYSQYLEMGNPSTTAAPTSATETDLIAILDTGCNQSCHGERWLTRYAAATNTNPVFVDRECPTFRGINGSVRTTGARNIELCLELLNGGLARGDLRSTEIADSEAPLLISLQAQRSLGLVIDIAAEVAHSQALGADLKLVIKDGLLGLRLLPAAVADDAAEVDLEDMYRDQRVPDEPDREGEGDESETDDGEDGHDYGNDLLRDEQGNGYLAIDNDSTRTMSKQQGDKIDAGLRDMATKDHHLWNQLSSKEKRRRHTVLPRGCKTFLLEVFAGVAMLSHIASQDFGFPVSSPVDVRYDQNYDLTTAKGRRNVEEIIERDDPYAITFSPVCTPWSPWTHMTPPDKKDELEAVRDQWRPVFKWIGKVTRDRLAKGRQVLIEHPWSSDAWNKTDLHYLLEEAPLDALTSEPLQAVRADQCQFGLRDQRSGLPHLKPTGFATATEPLKRKLSSRCPGEHYHQVLEGGDRCRRAQDWPRELCVAIVEGFMEAMDNNYTKAAFPAEADIEENPDFNTLSTIDGIYDDHDLAAIDNTNPEARRLDEQMEIEREEGPPPPHKALESDALRERRRRWRELPYTQRVALRRLHTMTGHASSSSMKRLLRTAGANPKAIAALDHFRCPVCENTKMPAPTPATRMPSEYKFNDEIAIDTFIVKDMAGGKRKVMSIVDMGTLFHVAGIVGHGDGPPSSAECANMLTRSWLAWAGAPKSVVMDRGVENRGQLQGLLKGHGVLLRFIGLGSPNQLGRGERQGGLLKELVQSTVVARQLVGSQDMEQAVTECTTVKNHRINHRGFVPSQWVLGYIPKEVDSLTVLCPEEHIGQHSEILDGTTAFARQMAIRASARESFAQLDSAHRIRSAMLRKTTATRGPFHTGDLVCFYRKHQGNKKGGGRWYGPARVIGSEGRSTLWIIHGGIPMTVSSEQCRHSTGEEAVSKRLVELRPSRKRRREEQAPPGLEDGFAYPFGDDLSGTPFGSTEQRVYVHAEQDNVTLPPLQPAPQTTTLSTEEEADILDGMSNAGEEVAPNTPQTTATTTVPHPPPGLPPIPETIATGAAEVPVGGPDEDADLNSADEPEMENIPQSRQESGDQAIVSTGNLNDALRRSPDNLDGVPRRHRSRSPPPTTRSAASRRPPGEAAPSTSERAFVAFLNRRVCRKTAAARKKELNYDKASGDKKKGIDEARGKEWSNWKNFEAVNVLLPEAAAEYLREHPEAKPTPMRWVDIDKAEPWETSRYKSRIVVRGDLERGADGTRTDSPTCSSLMLNLTLSMAASNKWKLRGGDITASFLQGERMTRTLVLRPPKGGLPDVPEGSLLLAQKPVYGTKDAPRGFWRRLHRVCLQLGLRAVPYENAAYVLTDSAGKLKGVMVSHVDDLLWCGDGDMDDIMTKLQAEFKFGTLEVNDSFTYCGRLISQDASGIRVTCPNVACKVRPISLTTDRKHNRGGKATENEISQLRSVVGSLNWVTRVCRPDIGYQVHRLQSVMKVATVGDLIACNSLLNYVKKTSDLGLHFAYDAFDYNDMQIVSITDASHAADYDVAGDGRLLGHRSQSGRVLGLCGSKFLESGEGKIHILSYHSNVIRRVCRSTVQAETLSMLSGYEEGEHLRAVLDGMHHADVDNKLVRAMDTYNLHMLTDCRSLEEHLKQAGLHTVGDKRLAIDLCGLRQMVWRDHGQEVGDPLYADAPPELGSTKVHWIETKTMLADSLTKEMKNHQILEVMKAGTLKVDFDKSNSKKKQVPL